VNLFAGKKVLAGNISILKIGCCVYRDAPSSIHGTIFSDFGKVFFFFFIKEIKVGHANKTARTLQPGKGVHICSFKL
jgi:hypothetical protein